MLSAAPETPTGVSSPAGGCSSAWLRLTCLSGAGPCLCPCPDAARAPGSAPGNSPRAGPRCAAGPGAAGCSRGTGWESAPGTGAVSWGKRTKRFFGHLPGGCSRVSPRRGDRERDAGTGAVPGGAAAGARAVGLGFDPMQAVFEGGEEDAAPLVAGHAGLLDDGDGRQEGLDGVAVVAWAGAERG